MNMKMKKRLAWKGDVERKTEKSIEGMHNCLLFFEHQNSMSLLLLLNVPHNPLFNDDTSIYLLCSPNEEEASASTVSGFGGEITIVYYAQSQKVHREVHTPADLTVR